VKDACSQSLGRGLPLLLQEIIPFFQNVTLTKTTTNVEDLYLELAEKVGRPPVPRYSSVVDMLRLRTEVSPSLAIPRLAQVRKGLGHIDPYFEKLANGMVAWIEGWRLLNPPKAA
jgi:reversibly glycosylated polypeptide/UDP-arabinopyranose mutase